MRDLDYDHTAETPYECFDCGTILVQKTNPTTCPDCGGDIRNRMTALE